MANEKNNATNNRPGTIVLSAEDCSDRSFDLDPTSEVHVSLRLVKEIENGFIGRNVADAFAEEFINTVSGFAVAPNYHSLVAQMSEGKIEIREFAAYCYLAGRMSTVTNPN